MQIYEPISKQHISKERNKARLLKQSNWWKNKINTRMCQYCGETFEKQVLTMDHKVPITKGGKTSKSNVVVSCKMCNTNKGTKTLPEIIIESLDK